MVFFVTAVDLQLVEDLQIWLQNTSAKQHFTTIRVKSKVHANKSHKETYCQTLSEYRSKELLKKNFQESFFFFFFFLIIVKRVLELTFMIGVHVSCNQELLNYIEET